jgi:hypothetical protein
MFQEFFSFFLGCCWEGGGGVLNCGCWNAHGISLELKEITAAVAMSCWVFLNSSSSLPRVHLLYRSSRGRLLRNTQATHTHVRKTHILPPLYIAPRLRSPSSILFDCGSLSPRLWTENKVSTFLNCRSFYER